MAIHVVTGGSGSGKSEYAEQLVTDMGTGPRIYIATMMIWDDEGKKRVDRHRLLREGKGFSTVERFTDLEHLELKEKQPVVLLECMSNLVSNEYFRLGKDAESAVIGGINALQNKCRHLMIVTNEVFSDGITYNSMTQEYIELLGRVNRYLGQAAQSVTEVIYGIPLKIK